MHTDRLIVGTFGAFINGRFSCAERWFYSQNRDPLDEQDDFVLFWECWHPYYGGF